MGFMLQGAVVGVVATICVDIWAVIAKRVLGLPTANWAMVGRWFGHISRGHLIHRPIANSAAIANELAIGWIGHYAIGIFYGLAYLYIVHALLMGEASFISALGFGLATLIAPWLVMQPAMGAGVFASRAPRPAVTRLVNVSMHAVFGAALYLGVIVSR
jgi:hypothetical protein